MRKCGIHPKHQHCKYDAKDLTIYDFTIPQFLNWLSNRDVLEYVIYEEEGDDVYILDTNEMTNHFLAENTRYQIVIRGERMFINDIIKHKDVVEMKFTPETKQLVQEEMEQICNKLNNNEIIIGR